MRSSIPALLAVITTGMTIFAQSTETPRDIDAELDHAETNCNQAFAMLRAEMTNSTSAQGIKNAVAAFSDCMLSMQQLLSDSATNMTPAQRERFTQIRSNQVAEALLYYDQAQQRIKLKEDIFNKTISANRFPPHTNETIKIPTFVECRPDELVIYPGEYHLTGADLAQATNRLLRLFRYIQSNSASQYVICQVHPSSAILYRQFRTMVTNYAIDVEYDAVNADFRVNWDSSIAAPEY